MVQNTFQTGNFNKAAQAKLFAFLDAVATGDLDAVKRIPEAEQRAMVNERDPRSGHMKRVGIIYASQNGRDDIVGHLIKMGADVNIPDEDGWTALIAATFNDNYKIAERLLDNKAKIDWQDNEGFTPLMEAISRGRREGTLMFIARGANLNLRNNADMNAHDMAVDLNQPDIAKALLAEMIKRDTTAAVKHMRGGTTRKIPAASPATFGPKAATP